VGYVYLGGVLVAQYQDGTTYFVHKDHLGSSRVLTRVDKSIHDSLDYLPYGEQISGDTGTTRKFTGKERDSESGLDNFGARMDSTTLGRFISLDPKTPGFRHLTNPQKWNRYAYTLNNPLVYVDPDGREEKGFGRQMLCHCAAEDRGSRSSRITWLFLLVFGNWLAAPVYFLSRYRRQAGPE